MSVIDRTNRETVERMMKARPILMDTAMAPCKCMALAAHGIGKSMPATTMACNGTDFGIRASSTGDRWLTAPSIVSKGLYFSGFTAAHANAHIRNSIIAETVGADGFAMAATSAIVNFIGGKGADAFGTEEMYEIAVAENNDFEIPDLDIRGTPAGIDAGKVVEKGILPGINTGIATKNRESDKSGRALSAPLQTFIDALRALAG